MPDTAAHTWTHTFNEDIYMYPHICKKYRFSIQFVYVPMTLNGSMVILVPPIQ